MNRKEYLQKKNKLCFEIEECNKIRFNPEGDKNEINEIIKKKKFEYKLLNARMKKKD